MEKEVIIERAGDEASNGSDAEAKLCIWLVDDDPCYCELLTCLLNADPRVDCLRSFSSASSLLAVLRQKTPPDAILMDVHMPVMNGIEAIRPIKHLSPSTMVLMLTTFLDHESKEQALVSGAVDFLLKRNSSAQIIAAILAASVRSSSACRANLQSLR
jgi:DNA-binding NarL/FixJ family response regulator